MVQQKTFCKSRKCPSTEMLLLFSGDALENDGTAIVVEHLKTCEFCFSEVRLLTDFPPLHEEHAPPEMPFQLRQLAEIMLGKETFGNRFLCCLFAGKKDSPAGNTFSEIKEKANHNLPFLFVPTN